MPKGVPEHALNLNATHEMEPRFLMIDLFCGAGGTTTGAEKSNVCKVIAAINHDPLAIASHSANHSGVFHMTEDILLADLTKIKSVVDRWRKKYPSAKLIIWASLECTNFSNAKGGQPRDADSRTLANGLFRYLDALNPDYLLIENVREFMCWGDLDEKGKPVSKYEGRDYVRWVKRVQSYGFDHDWRLLCAANFGGVTIRERYFGAFWKKGEPFAWPQPTHVKKAAKKDGLFSDELKPWRAVAEVLDFSDLGKSIFERKKPLVDKTLRRILAGLKKFHAEPQIMVCNSPGYCHSVFEPIGALTTKNSKAFLVPFLQSYYNNGGTSNIKHPAPTLTTKDRLALVTPFIYRDFKSATNRSIFEPSGAILTVPKMSLCSAFLLPSSFDNGARSVNEPAPTILASRKHINIASAFIVNPSFGSNGHSVFKPAPTVIAKQKSWPLSLASATGDGSPKWKIRETDSAAMIELKTYMKDNGITDVFMRMLKVKELKLIQGFPPDYVLKGPLNEQKKFIGNSVETGVVAAWLRAMAEDEIKTGVRGG